MPDTLTPSQRRKAMRANRSKGVRSTEWALRARLVSAGISGWTMHSREVEGTPDFAFPEPKVAIFVDGCFWHGCRKHRSIPETNPEFWKKKIEGNRRRDRRVNRLLKDADWTVLRVWEHELKETPDAVVSQIASLVASPEK